MKPTSMATKTRPTASGLSKERLDEVVNSIKTALCDEQLRTLSQRAVQSKIWHLQPALASCMADLRSQENTVRDDILRSTSELIYKFHDKTLEATLARAGILEDERVHAGSSLHRKKDFDLFCLDAKERLYLALNHYGWMQDFFRTYPQHFYENSFQFVDRIPAKKLNVKVKVVGLGIGGSMAVSGLARAGIDGVVGYEKRDESGPRRVGSRYQNASWRAYDIAERLLDEEAYQELITYRQRLNVTYDDGTSDILASDRVQIILGNAIEAALASAKRYGAKLEFGTNLDAYFREGGVDEPCDIVALFAGAHTSKIIPGLEREMVIHSWPELSSRCKMWLRVKESTRGKDYCTRGGEIGAEKWHYTIESARRTKEDVLRVRDNIESQFKYEVKKLPDKHAEEEASNLKTKFDSQLAQIDDVLNKFEDKENTDGVAHFDYIFTNAPDNEHNRSKRDQVGIDGTVVLDGGYQVDVKFASKCAFGETNFSPTIEKLLEKFSAKLLVTGGDACVPPNPLAAYGATLACESADMVVHLAIAYGHLNTIITDMEMYVEQGLVDAEWVEEVKTLRASFTMYYEVRSRSENFFQWVQTAMCNAYSLPPMTT